MKKLGIFLSLLFALIMLQGCSKGSSSSSSASTPSTVRLINATTDYASLDLVSSGAAVASAVASASVSNYATINSGSSTFTLERSGAGTPSAQATFMLSSGVNYTLVAYTSGQQLLVTAFTDNEVAPSPGDGKIRVSNFSSDAGSVDIYMSESGGDLSTASVLTSYVTGTTGYFEITKGTYHLWITGAGDKTDLRLDIPSIAISDQQVLTLILTSATGGVLVDGLFVTQQGAVSTQKNGSARVRVAANIAANGNIAATANGVSLASTLRSPVVGSYALVPAGALSMNVMVNGNNVNPGNLNAAAGADLTLLAVGDSASPQFFLLNDDNRRSLNGMTKLRLVNGVNGLADVISLTADYNLMAQNVPYGTASTAASVSSNTSSRLEVNSSQGNTSLYLATDVNLQSAGVYSVFMLGNNAAPVGILRRDR